MADLINIIDTANSVRATVHNFGLLPIAPVRIMSHKDSLEFLSYFNTLKQFLPHTYYSDNHFVGTDPFSNAAIVKHIDFESDGRGGLYFKLERIYSSLAAYSSKGEFLINSQIKSYYQALRHILESDSFINNIRKWFHEVYRDMMIEARILENRSEGQDDNIGPVYENSSLFPDVDSLINSVNVLHDRYRDTNPWNLTLCIDQDHRVHRVDDIGWGSNEYLNMLPPGAMGPLYALIYHLRLLYNDFLSFVHSSVHSINTTISTLDEQKTVFVESSLGAGWNFNLPFLKVPDPETNQNGFIFFLGYIKEDYNGEAERKYLKQKGYLIKLDSFPIVREPLENLLEIYSEPDNREIKQGDIDSLGYRFKDVDNKYFYFDTNGRLKYITDETHRNVIIIEYVGALISRIIDAAGNAYTFVYDANNKLAKITSSYGKEINYTIKGSNTIEGVYLLESISEGVHITSYEYQDVRIFNAPQFIDGEVKLPIMNKETNPLGGTLTFLYHNPIYDTHSPGFSGTSIINEDPNLCYTLGIRPYCIERIYRGRDKGNILLGHPKMKEGTINYLPWKLSFRKTFSIFKDRIDEYEYRECNGELRLFKRSSSKLDWNSSFGISFLQYSNFIRDLLKSEMFQYFYEGILEKYTLTLGNASTGNPSTPLAVEYIYPNNNSLWSIYGLPKTIIIKEHNGFELRRIEYSYHQHLPLITEVKGDTKFTVYQYFSPFEQDPAGCRKPTIVRERTVSSPYSEITTKHWYDKYGNLIKTQNAENRITRYEYKENNGLPDVFLHKIIEEER